MGVPGPGTESKLTTYGAAAATQDSITHCTGLGIDPESPRPLELLQLDSLPTVPRWELPLNVFVKCYCDGCIVATPAHLTIP